MGDLQRETDPARRIVRAFARLIFAVIYFRRTKCQSISSRIFNRSFPPFRIVRTTHRIRSEDRFYKPSTVAPERQ